MSYEVQAATVGKLYDLAIARLNSATQIATISIQSLLLLNGGAIVAILGLLAQGRDAPVLKNVYLLTVIWSLIAYAIACATTLLAAILGHGSQARMSGGEVQEARRFFETGKLGLTPTETKVMEFADSMLDYGVIAISVALALFIVGSGLLAWAFLAARP